MKIALASDLHLEFGPLVLNNTENCDVLILSGDIMIARDLELKNSSSERYHEFMFNCSKEFPHVIYIMGNHEHYGGDFKYTHDILKNNFKDLTNVHILEKEHVVIDDIIFIGGTLWTDCNNGDPITIHCLKNGLNDYRHIKNSHFMSRQNVIDYEAMGVDPKEYHSTQFLKTTETKKDVIWRQKEVPVFFTPEHTINEHKIMLDYIKHVCHNNSDKKIVVVGHHAPTKISTHPRYVNDKELNGGYSSDLSEFILNFPQIKFWTHGHTHHPFEYKVGETLIACNPRGYVGYEVRTNEFMLKYLEI